MDKTITDGRAIPARPNAYRPRWHSPTPNEANLTRPPELDTKAGGGMTQLLTLKRQAKGK